MALPNAWTAAASVSSMSAHASSGAAQRTLITRERKQTTPDKLFSDCSSRPRSAAASTASKAPHFRNKTAAPASVTRAQSVATARPQSASATCPGAAAARAPVVAASAMASASSPTANTPPDANHRRSRSSLNLNAPPCRLAYPAPPGATGRAAVRFAGDGGASAPFATLRCLPTAMAPAQPPFPFLAKANERPTLAMFLKCAITPAARCDRSTEARRNAAKDVPAPPPTRRFAASGPPTRHKARESAKTSVTTSTASSHASPGASPRRASSPEDDSDPARRSKSEEACGKARSHTCSESRP
mmetsp:Transcript_14268/g.50782  ORF Transcript_14268/g.50782 Transcript_14268/m.50782 type:complete len:302 (+) Transcript_14268:483-1388(+)